MIHYEYEQGRHRLYINGKLRGEYQTIDQVMFHFGGLLQDLDECRRTSRCSKELRRHTKRLLAQSEVLDINYAKVPIGIMADLENTLEELKRPASGGAHHGRAVR